MASEPKLHRNAMACMPPVLEAWPFAARAVFLPVELSRGAKRLSSDTVMPVPTRPA